jgi:cellulose synthase/poly-beta-1,6-N-acetylglucosamine synthase-like glycosyltransferase
MSIIETLSTMIFWLSLMLLFHTWLGYTIILMLLPNGRTKRVTPEEFAPTEPGVSVIIAVHNADNKILSKLNDISSLDYPPSKMEIIVVSDGSTDHTVDEAKLFGGKNLKVYELPKNMGKSAAQNFGVEKANYEILLFTDVDSVLEKNFVRRVVAHFNDPKVACVGGVALLKAHVGQIGKSQGLYWRIEQFVRVRESDLGMVYSLPGWGFAARKSDFSSLDLDTGDDMILPMEMALKGKRSVIASDAFVIDTMPSSLQGVFSARQRIALRNFTGAMRRKALLAPWLFPKMAFALWSHKLLKWLSPILLILLFLSNLWLCLAGNSLPYDYSLLAQLIFYSVGLIDLLSVRMGIEMKVPFLRYLSSFLLANAAFLVALWKFALGQGIKTYRNVE